jgi:hypothetical protein
MKPLGLFEILLVGKRKGLSLLFLQLDRVLRGRLALCAEVLWLLAYCGTSQSACHNRTEH